MNGNNQGEEADPAGQSLISHLVELRNRLVYSIISVFVVLAALFYFTSPNEIYSYLAGPLLKQLPTSSTMIATEVASPFFTPFKLTMVVAVFIAIPFILYQFWAFVAPGLYKHERRLILPLLIASTFLFFLGAAFAYYVVFPLAFGFLTHTAPTGVAVMTDISKYLDFILTMLFAFGICFEVPIFTIVLVWSGLVSPKSLSEQRPYVIVGAFVIGMFLTPPDAFSQTLLAVPMWLLFEIGLLFSKLFVRDSNIDTESDRKSIEKNTSSKL